MHRLSTNDIEHVHVTAGANVAFHRADNHVHIVARQELWPKVRQPSTRVIVVPAHNLLVFNANYSPDYHQK
jgi:hypothetical protein